MVLRTYYKSLNEIPIGYFNKCLSGDLRFTAKDKKGKGRKALKVWKKLFQENLDKRGLPDSYLAYIRKMQKAISHYQKAFNGQRWELTRAKVAEAEAKEIAKPLDPEPIEITCGKISKFMGFRVTADTCPVNEFYNYLDIMNNTK